MAKGKKQKAARVSRFRAFVKESKKRWDKSVTVASDMPILPIPRLSTGNFGLDIATFGGLPPGITRFWGTPRSTKTGSCLNAVVNWQKYCGHCFERDCDCEDWEPAGVLWVDAEGKTSDSIMMPWVIGHGVDPAAFLIERPDSGNEIVDVIDSAIRSGIKLVVLDSIAHMTVKDEIEKASEDGITPGRMAMLVNSAMRKWTMAQTSHGFTDEVPVRLLLINQIRSTFSQYSPETLPGGNAQKFATRLDIRFHATKSRRRYRSVKSDGSFKDLKKPPTPDCTPEYQETDYRVTTSSQCPAGRYGSYNYWLKEAYGRRIGDPDNAAQMVVYMRRYKCFQRIKGGWAIKLPDEWATCEAEEETHCQAATQAEVIESFRADELVQEMVWRAFVRELCKV